MVTVKLFGTLRIDAGIRELTAEAGSIRELYPIVLREIREKSPESPVTEKTLRACLIAVNGTRAGFRTKLRHGDVVFFFTAAAGG